jgi:hypothetical protein
MVVGAHADAAGMDVGAKEQDFKNPEQKFGAQYGIGTKNRQKQTADICKQHLREKYQRGLVEEFILEFEGDRKNCDVTCWDRFTDIKDIKKEMLRRLEAHFEKWLNP